jgi:hypothetical protein
MYNEILSYWELMFVILAVTAINRSKAFCCLIYCIEIQTPKHKYFESEQVTSTNEILQYTYSYNTNNNCRPHTWYKYYYFEWNTARFIMFSVVTNIHNNKIKGPSLMELFTVTGKLKKFF